MQVVILAGGLGPRLSPVIKRVLKPLVPVAGAPYLEHQFLRLYDIGTPERLRAIEECLA